MHRRARSFLFAANALLLLVTPIALADVLYVHASATGANDGSSWADAFVDLQAALEAAALRSGVRLRWHVQGAGEVASVDIERRSIPGAFVRVAQLDTRAAAGEWLDTGLADSGDLGEQAAGIHHVRWDGTDDNGRGVATGVYVVRLQTEWSTDEMRVVLLK